jgi:transitional endoplasmic reticulum ATPase
MICTHPHQALPVSAPLPPSNENQAYATPVLESCPTLPSLVRLWILRVVVSPPGAKAFVTATGFSNHDIAEALGCPCEGAESETRFDQAAARKKLRTLLEAAEVDSAVAKGPIALERNVAQVRALIDLGDDDCILMRYAILARTETLLAETLNLLGRFSGAKTHRVLGSILKVPISRIQRTLAPEGLLAQSGLIVEDPCSYELSGKLDLLSRKFATRMTSGHTRPIDLLRGIVNVGPASELTTRNYDHLRDDVTLLGKYLRVAASQRRTGVNVLLYGPPGTGKTQLARLIAGELSLPLYEIASEDDGGEVINGASRLKAFRIAQTIFGRQHALVVFDEIEDIFGSANSGPRQARKGIDSSKAWLNRTLENNPLPTFWITNDVREIDPAYVRRFDCVLKVSMPSREARKALLIERSGNRLADLTLQRIASHPHIAPALVTRTTSLLDTVRDELSPEQYESGIVRLLDQSLRAQGHAPIAEAGDHGMPSFYDLSFINTDENLADVLAGIRRAGSARLCLYGMPGTGKTAFGRYLAEQLQRPLHATRASDILSPYVGMTERNLAEAFAEAKVSKAVLLIDEVDSFLQDRTSASKNWEITAVNEMLTQMESFPGVFIASTNLMTNLDPAALRRFDLKIQFCALRPEQAWELLIHHSLHAGLGEPDRQLYSLLEKQTVLTPGDFAAVSRRHRFYPFKTAESLVNALVKECALKPNTGPRGPIGFGIRGGDTDRPM